MQLTLHQALFGYDGGHQMLTASMPLPIEARHFLSVATDLSGSAPARGFDQAFTGTPIPGSNLYALFSTWLAPEMPRPGCVWSHVLLVQLPDLAAIENLSWLRAAFQRPSGDSDSTSYYSKPISFKVLQPRTGRVSLIHTTMTHEVLRLLYVTPDQQVVAPAKDEKEYEELLFAIWSQQWPRLRRNFRFSTGSFADRGRLEQPFDLQVTPAANVNYWHHDRVLFVGSNERNASAPIGDSESWLQVASLDLLCPDTPRFRTFLSTYGADVSALRPAYGPLAKAFARFSVPDPQAWELTLASIATDFPTSDDAGTLKHASVTATGIEVEDDSDILVSSIRFLLLQDEHGAFDKVRYDFGDAVERLWPQRKKDLLAVLAEPPSHESRWTGLATALVERIEPHEISSLAESNSELIGPFVRLRPELVTTADAWCLSERYQWILVEALERAEVRPELWSKIVAAMLSARSTVAVRQVVNRAGSAALAGAVQWLLAEEPPRDLPQPIWREALRPFAEARLKEERLPPVELAFCAAIVSPDVAGMLDAKRVDVQMLASTPLQNLPPALQLPTAFLLVAVGLKASGEDGAPLLSRAFFRVYEALESASEPPEAWRLLQPHLPPVWFWEEWDRCLTLRRGLQKWLRQNPEAYHAILAATRGPNDRYWLQLLH